MTHLQFSPCLPDEVEGEDISVGGGEHGEQCGHVLKLRMPTIKYLGRAG